MTMTSCRTTRGALLLLLGVFALCLAMPGRAADQPADQGQNTAKTSSTPTEGQDQGFTLNLQNADLRSLINTVSKRTGRNFIVDPRVNAKVTVISSTPVKDKELYDIFEQVLAVHGYAAVPAGDVTKIVPAVAAKQEAIPVDSGSGGDVVTRVVAVQNINAAQLVPILRPLLPQQAHLAAYQPTNRLLITDTAANIDRLVKIIGRVDRPVQRDIEVIHLDHASASEVVNIINSLEQPSGQGQGQPGQGPKLAADPRTNSVLVNAPREERLRIRTLIANLDTPLEHEGATRVMYLKYANAKDLVDVLKGVSQAQAKVANGKSKGKDGGSIAGDEVSVQADPNTNALIITGPPDRLRNIQDIVHQLDIRRAQVLVEAIIAEISEDKARELGVQFAFDGSDNNRPAGATSFGSGGSNIVSLASNPSSLASGLTIGALRQGAGKTSFAVLLRALASDANTNILSTPSLVTLDNQEAKIVVGQNVPFVTGQYTSTGANNGVSNPFQTIERRDVGLTLKVKPQINEGDTLKMDIDQEVSSIASSAQTTADVVTNKRSLTTTVQVKDDQTLVLGGLIDNTVRTTAEQVPLLGDIPVLGQLFRYKKTSKQKRNLMVFIHPRILRDLKLANTYTGEKYNYLRQKQLQRKRDHDDLMIDQLPVLPELHLQQGGTSGAPSGNDHERTGSGPAGQPQDTR